MTSEHGKHGDQDRRPSYTPPVALRLDPRASAAGECGDGSGQLQCYGTGLSAGATCWDNGSSANTCFQTGNSPG